MCSRASVWIYASACLALQLLCLLWLKSRGFLAISDDDYSRVVIAQQFADSPRIDPSATSWLPFPFWLNGAFMLLFGATLEIARLSATIWSLACTGLLFAAIYTSGLNRLLTAAVCLACVLLPSSLWLAAATVPECPTAVLVTISALSLMHPLRSVMRLMGAFALFAATASRYEAWPVALVFCAWCLYDYMSSTTRSQSGAAQPRSAWPAIISVAFPCLWLLHGAINHKNAFFFVKRVADYKRALGDDLPDFMQLLGGYPRALMMSEPLPIVLVVLLVISRWRRGEPELTVVDPASDLRSSLTRGGSVIVAQLAFLMIGAAQGGAPTHHPERALLSIWMILLVGAGLVLSRLRHANALSIGFFILIISSHGLQPWAQRINESRARSSEEAVGRRLKADAPNAPVALSTDDFGYFSIMAAAANPRRFSVLADHDPRKSAAQAPLEPWLKRPNHCLFVVSDQRDVVGSELVYRDGALTLRRAQACAN